MPARCPICILPPKKRLPIDQALVKRTKTQAAIAAEFGFKLRTVEHHKINHLARQLVVAHRLREEKHARNLITDMNASFDVLDDVLMKAQATGRYELILKTLTERRNTFESLAKIGVLQSVFGEELSTNPSLTAYLREKELISAALKSGRLTEEEVVQLGELHAKLFPQASSYKDMDGSIEDRVLESIDCELKDTYGIVEEAEVREVSNEQEETPRHRKRRTRIEKD